MVEIVKIENEKKFGDLPVSNWFEYDGMVFLKLNTLTKDTAVCLSDDALSNIVKLSDELLVCPLEVVAGLKVKRI